MLRGKRHRARKLAEEKNRRYERGEEEESWTGEKGVGLSWRPGLRKVTADRQRREDVQNEEVKSLYRVTQRRELFAEFEKLSNDYTGSK